jgi:hypothetical protein
MQDPTISIAVAAIQTLTSVIKKSKGQSAVSVVFV